MISRQVATRIEVYFWSSIIWLISESRFAQRCLQAIYQLKPARQAFSLPVVLACAIIGALLGILLGVFGI